MRTGLNTERARAFVEQHGTPIERARAAALLGGRRPAEVPPEIGALQNPDGGFPYELQVGEPSALHHTLGLLLALEDLGLGADPVADGAYTYVLSRQTRRGIWREAGELRRFALPPWMDPESTWADIYTTAFCAGRLASRAEANLAIDRAVAWLQTQQGRDGLLEGFQIHASALAVPAFVEILEREGRATRRLVAGLGGALSDEWTPMMLALLLKSMLDAGYTTRTEVVERAWQQIQGLQQPDGSFAPADETESAVEITLMVLGVARQLGRDHEWSR